MTTYYIEVSGASETLDERMVKKALRQADIYCSDCSVFTTDPFKAGQDDALEEQKEFDEELRRYFYGYCGQEERAALEESIKARLGWRQE